MIGHMDDDNIFLKSKRLSCLILRVCIWEIKSNVFSSQGCHDRSYEENMILAKEIVFFKVDKSASGDSE